MYSEKVCQTGTKQIRLDFQRNIMSTAARKPQNIKVATCKDEATAKPLKRANTFLEKFCSEATDKDNGKNSGDKTKVITTYKLMKILRKF